MLAQVIEVQLLHLHLLTPIKIFRSCLSQGWVEFFWKPFVRIFSAEKLNEIDLKWVYFSVCPNFSCFEAGLQSLYEVSGMSEVDDLSHSVHMSEDLFPINFFQFHRFCIFCIPWFIIPISYFQPDWLSEVDDRSHSVHMSHWRTRQKTYFL